MFSVMNITQVPDFFGIIQEMERATASEDTIRSYSKKIFPRSDLHDDLLGCRTDDLLMLRSRDRESVFGHSLRSIGCNVHGRCCVGRYCHGDFQDAMYNLPAV